MDSSLLNFYYAGILILFFQNVNIPIFVIIPTKTTISQFFTLRLWGLCVSCVCVFVCSAVCVFVLQTSRILGSGVRIL